LEQISFEARDSEYIDNKSGISARMSITALENLMSTAERRALKTGVQKTSLRLSDFLGIIPSITGKVELVYEGEQEGAAMVAQQLIANAIQTCFPGYFPKIEKLEKQGEKTPYSDTIEWFFTESGFELLDDASDEEYKALLDEIKPLDVLVKKYQPQLAKEDHYFIKEFILWGLVEFKKLSKDRVEVGFQFKDIYGSYISKL
jgi:magnesium chelatase subunit I